MGSYNTGDECFKALPLTTVEGHMYRAYPWSKRVYVRLTLRWGRVDIVCFISVHQLDPSPLLYQTFLHPSLSNICKQRASKSLLSSHVWLTCIDDFCTGCRNFSHLEQQSPFKDFTHPDEHIHIPPTSDMILGVKPFALYIDYFGFKALFLGFHKFASFDRPGTIYSVINNCLTQPSFSTRNIVYRSWPAERWQALPVHHWLSTTWYTMVNIIKTWWFTRKMETRNRISQTHGGETNILYSVVNIDNMIDQGCV